jgi:hypothetical protein
MDYDFYDNYDEFDQQIDEFKQSLMRAVKKEVVDEIETLRKENDELQSVKENWEMLKQEYYIKELELENKKNDSLSEARKMRLSDLLKDKEIILYYLGAKYIEKPKCNNCDKNREIHFTSPSGKNFSEHCECSVKDILYIPEEYVLYEFRLNEYNSELLVWYRRLQYNENHGEYFEGSLASVTNIYNRKMKYEDIDSHDMFFRNKEDCQKYCDWYNGQRKKAMTT